MRYFASYMLKSLVLTAGLGMGAATQALEAINDRDMASATGEGIAFLPENFSVRFGDTSYINIVPRGPTTSDSDKADIYVYGLSLGSNRSQAINTSSRYVQSIGSWGSASNPFALSVSSAIVPTLSDTADPATGATYKSQSYIRLAAPRLADQTYSGSIPELPVEDGTFLHLGLWADIIEKDNNGNLVTAAYYNNGSQSTYNSMFRTQVIGDLFSLNGSEVRLFATSSNYVYNVNGSSYSTSANRDASANSSYNNTMGAAVLFRLNSRNDGYFRISTAQADGTVAGPLQPSGNSVFASSAPSFLNTDGVYVRNLDINLPLGQLGYQPLVYDVAPDGRNFMIELARVPNNATAYNALYNGSVCYQWSCSGATRGSITAGDVNFNTTTRTLEASTTGPGDGIKMVSPSGVATNLGNVAVDGITLQHLKIRTTGL